MASTTHSEVDVHASAGSSEAGVELPTASKAGKPVTPPVTPAFMHQHHVSCCGHGAGLSCYVSPWPHHTLTLQAETVTP